MGKPTQRQITLRNVFFNANSNAYANRAPSRGAKATVPTQQRHGRACTTGCHRTACPPSCGCFCKISQTQAVIPAPSFSSLSMLPCQRQAPARRITKPCHEEPGCLTLPQLSVLSSHPAPTVFLQAKVADMMGTGDRDHDHEQPSQKCSISSPSADYFRAHQKKRAEQFGSPGDGFMSLLEEPRGWETA